MAEEGFEPSIHVLAQFPRTNWPRSRAKKTQLSRPGVLKSRRPFCRFPSSGMHDGRCVISPGPSKQISGHEVPSMALLRSSVRVFALIFLGAFVLPAANLVAQSNPVPLVNQPLVPTSVVPGSPGLTLTVNGTGFVSTSVVNWNGATLATTFVTSSKLFATVPASDVTVATTASVTVFSPAPGGGTSNAVPFTVTVPTSGLAFSLQLSVSGLIRPPSWSPISIMTVYRTWLS